VSVGRERLLINAGMLAIFLAIWEAAPALGYIDPLFTSSPSRIVAAGIDLFRTGEIWPDIYVSATEFLWGYLAAIVVAVPLGLVIGWSRRAQYFFGPLIDVMNAVPRITFLPILILWFGIGVWSKLAVVFLGAVVPITIATMSGVRTSESRFLRVAKSFGASNLKLFTSVIAPGAVPFIFTGLKYGAGRALLGVVVGEVYASTAGVGHMIADAGNTLQTDIVFVGVLLFTLTGLAINFLLERFEKHFDRWRPLEPAR
jgi:ABC-type nitrate/sulfonate/bicarbonate transport system permease component